MSKTAFTDLGLIRPLLDAVAAAGYEHPTPIQAAAIPPALAGRDLVATARTGTGKTAAFTLPLLQGLAGQTRGGPDGVRRPRRPRALILTPTRELAQQIGESLRIYGQRLPLRSAVVVGGVRQESQVEALRRGVDILVATPGRLRDLVEQGHAVLGEVGVFVLDEADRMLDMGFIHEVRHLAGLLPRRRQTLLFSATISPQVARLTADLQCDPLSVEVSPPASISVQVDQRVFFVAKTRRLRSQSRSTSGCSSWPRPTSRRFWSTSSPRETSRARWSSPAPSTAPTAWPGGCARPGWMPTPSMPTGRSPRGNGRWRPSATDG